jgi:hypothetical protein
MSSAGKVVITQLVVDASGAKTGVAEFEAALAKAKAVANDTSGAIAGGPNSFDGALKKWTQSLAATDPVLKAQIQAQKALQQQTEINTRAVALGIVTQDAAATQLDKVRQKYEGHVAAARAAANENSAFSKSFGFIVEQAGPLIGLLSAAAVIGFAKSTFENAAALKSQAEQAGVNVEAFQAYQAVMKESGIANDDAAQLLTKLTHSIGDARNVAGPARDAFVQLGIGAKDLTQGVEGALPKIAQALLQIPDATERARLEADLFGRTGQKLESALRVLIEPTADLVEKEKALGQVLGQDVADGADKAANRLDSAWKRIKNDVTPVVVELTEKMADLIDAYDKWASRQGPPPMPAATQGPTRGLGMFGSAGILGSLPVPNGVGPSGSTSAPPAFSSDNETKYLAAAQQAADLAGLTVTRRAQEVATIGLANAKLQDGTIPLSDIIRLKLQDQNGHLVKQVANYEQARDLLGAAATKHVEALALITAQGDQWRKVKETFDGYLGGLSEETRIAGENAAQRQVELDVIKGAQIVQKQRGDDEKNLVQTYDQALGKLSAGQVAEIQRRDAAKMTAGFEKSISDQLAIGATALAAGRDDRDLAVAIAQKQLDLGRQLTDEEKARLKLIQQQNDAAGLKDYIVQLKEEASLAGLSADERERQAAVLQAMHAMHGELSADQAKEISGIIEARQETEKWRSVVEGITNGFENFFEKILTKGKASFGDLWRAIEGSFAQMLAQMASQALVQPIIIPMVQDIVGQISGGMSSLGLGGGSASSGGGILSSLGSLGSLGQSSGLLGSSGGGMFAGLGSSISGGISSLGSFLGFGTDAVSATSMLAMPSAAGAFGSTIGGGTAAISSTMPALEGSVFSSSLGSMFGGFGAGTLASSLVFGNKNDASGGSMAGAAAGAMIGSVVPVIGTIIGGLIGGLLGGGIGSMTGSDNQSSTLNFTNGGLGSTVVQQGSQKNTQAASAAADQISQAIKTLQGSGVDVSLNGITGVNIGSSKSYVYDAAGGKQKFGADDVTSVVNAVLDRILSTAKTGDPNVQKVLDNYGGGLNSGNISQFMQDIGTAKALTETTFGDTSKKLTAIGQALQQITDQFDQAVQKAKDIGIDTQSLEDARDAAVRAVVDGFDQSVADGIQQLADPITATMQGLVAQQKSRLADATEIGANIEKVQQENDLETQAALKGYLSALQPANDNLSQWQQRAESLAQAEKDAATAATALGQGLDQVQAAAGKAHAALAGEFNSSIHDAILQITNPDLAKYNDLLGTQAQRIQDAVAAQGDLNAVYVLNALEQQQLADSQAQVIQQAADQAKAAAAQAAQALAQFDAGTADSILKITNPALATYNELLTTQAQRIKDAAAVGGDLNKVLQLNSLELDQLAQQSLQQKLGQALQGLGDNVGDLTSQANDAAKAAANAASGWASAKTSLDKASSALLISDPSLSPGDQYGNARGQFDQLRSAALSGNVTAAGDISSFASTFLQKSFAYNGSTSAYGDDLNYVQSTLSTLSSFAQTQQSAAEAQAAAYSRMITLLDQINTAIKSQTTQTQAAFDDLSSEVGELAAELRQENMQARQGL